MIGVKICGVCHPADGALAVGAGATHVGVILGAGGPRVRTESEAVAIFAAVADAVRVGVFADADPRHVIEVANRLALGAVQLHGAETPDIVAEIAASGAWQVWKAVRPDTADELAASLARWSALVDALLIDAAVKGRTGGTGVAAPWKALAAARWQGRPSLVLAGGLRPDNIAEAIDVLTPDIVDVSSGVEASIGRKDPERVGAFVRNARSAARPAETAGRSAQ
jgi:phosphoribosylanthranilate isomerase